MTSTELSTLAEQKTYAELLSQSSLLPTAYRNQPANVFVAIAMGEVLGLAPIEAINQINVINGRPTPSADLIAALIRGAGHKLRVSVTSDPPTATAILIRADDPDYEYKVVWDQHKAQVAGLWGRGESWKKYPEQMMRARAISEVGRMGASDALHGFIYTPEEMGGADPNTTQHGGMLATQHSPARPTHFTPPAPVSEPVTVEVEVVEEPAEPQETMVDVVDETTGEILDVEPDMPEDQFLFNGTEPAHETIGRGETETSPEQVEQVNRILDLYTKLGLTEEQLYKTFRYCYPKRLPGKQDEWTHWPYRSLNVIADYMQQRLEENQQ